MLSNEGIKVLELMFMGRKINPTLIWDNKEFTPDMDLAKKSLQKLTYYDIESVICYHGGVYKDNVNQQVLELANK